MNIGCFGVNLQMIFKQDSENQVLKIIRITLSGFLTIAFSMEMSIASEEPGRKSAAVSLATLASRADLVAVAQVKDTDYAYTRSFPSEGSAYLKILISYKHDQPNEEIIAVYDKGLHPN